MFKSIKEIITVHLVLVPTSCKIHFGVPILAKIINARVLILLISVHITVILQLEDQFNF